MLGILKESYQQFMHYSHIYYWNAANYAKIGQYDKGYKIIGIDFIKEAIDKLKKKDSSLDVRVGDITKLNFEDNYFDYILAFGLYHNLNETLEAVALDGDQNEIFKVPISEVVSKLSSQSGIKYLLLDGIITKRLLEGAKNAGIECVIGHRVAKLTNSDGMTLKTFADLGVS